MSQCGAERRRATNTEADPKVGLAPCSRRKRGDNYGAIMPLTLVSVKGKFVEGLCEVLLAFRSLLKAMAKTNVYVDGFNLYYGAVKDTPYRWLDLAKLGKILLPGDTIQAIKYFTARVSGRPHDPDQPTRQQIYLRALKTIPDLTIVYGHFLTHSRRMVLTGSNPPKKVWVDVTEEKGSDVNLGTHLLHDGFKGLYELAVLITNDSDLLEPVRIVRHHLGLSVGILNPHQYHSCVLRQHATFVKRIRQAHTAACQSPETMTDAKATFHKPSGW